MVRMKPLLLLLLLAAAVQAAPAAPYPPAEPFDCSWIYHPPEGPAERFEGIYTSFIDSGGFFACASALACAGWMGRQEEEVAFSERASEQFQRRTGANYGVFMIVFEGRRGRLSDRPGCEPHRFSVNPTPGHYLRIEKVVSVRAVKDKVR